MDLLLEVSVPQQQKRVAVIVGRFQPPTMGHYAVIDAVKKYIRENPELKLDPIPVVVVVVGKETSKDKARNPLTGKERVSFMEGSGRANGVRFLLASSAFNAFEAVRKAKMEPIAVAAGTDRADNYLEMLDKYFKGSNGSSIDHYQIVVGRDAESTDFGDLDKDAALDDILQYMDDELPVSMVSGSLARRAVEKNMLDKFTVITGLEAKPELAKLLFNKLKRALPGENDGAA